MSGLSDIYELEQLIDGIAGMIQGISMLIAVLGIAFVLATYFVHGYALMCTGRKAKVEGDFMPFVPVARQIYQMKIARCPVWYIFFFGNSLVTWVSVGLILTLLYKLTGNMAIITVLLIVYVLANMVFTFLYYQKFYELFGFNPNTAWMNIIPAFWPVAKVFGMLIAFSNSIRFGKFVEQEKKPGDTNVVQNRGVIVGTVGMYKDATFDLADGSELVFGRSTQEANIVFDQSATDVSRKHCVVRFDGRSNQYVVTDYSSNGTYLESGSRLESGQPKQLSRGTVIYLGSSRRNGFRLN
ncbi:MAG: FHA domain-containing protein [Clostridiales bacterium]|nr:FHA domain-containing protein [Clostridiales bacterium]